MNQKAHFPSQPGQLVSLDADAIHRLISTSSDYAILLDEKGIVKDIFCGNEAHVQDDIKAWIGQPFLKTLTVESLVKLDMLVDQAKHQEEPKWRQLNHVTEGDDDFPASYAAVPGPDTGTTLLLGRDKRELILLQQRLVKAQLTIEQDYERIRQVESRYRVLFETGTDALLIISAESARIVDANSSAARMLQREQGELSNRTFTNFVTPELTSALTQTLDDVRTKGGQKSVVLTLKPDGRRVWLDALLFRSVSDTLILCRIRPQTITPGTDHAFHDALMGLFQRTGDALVFTDKEGMILHSNAAFQSMTNVAMVERLQETSLADFLGRPSVDLSVMTGNAEQAGKLAIYSTTLRTEFGGQIPVEISATYLPDQSPPGFAFLIRDVSRLEASRQNTGAVSSEAVEHVVELVGSTPLKELVRGTTDVVEKLCIETAIRLTNNNRAAAAEMLGLSRQSLYVKLRRYNLVDQED